MKVDKILVTVEDTSTYTFEVSPETGFDDIPLTLGEMGDYVNKIKTSPEEYFDITNKDDHELLTPQGIVTTRKVTCID